jgi:hypothetical protein
MNEVNSRNSTDGSLQTGSLLAVGGFFGSVLLYQFVPAEGEQSSILSFIDKYTSRSKDWEEINALHTKAMEQAGYDRNLFENGGNKHRFVDVAYPEFVIPPANIRWEPTRTAGKPPLDQLLTRQTGH